MNIICQFIAYGFAACTFDQGFCQYSNLAIGDFNWTRAMKTTSSSTGPSNDHTTQSTSTGNLIIQLSNALNFE